MMEDEKPQKTVTVDPCPHCGEEFSQDGKGRMARARHIKQAHPDTTYRAKSEQTEEEYINSLPPLGARFYEAVKRIIPKSPPKIKSMSEVFSRNVASLGSNRETFRNWVQRYGFSSDQLAMLEDEMFGYGSDWGGGTQQSGAFPQSPQGGTQIMGYIPQPGGGMQPVFFVMPNQPPQQPAYPNQPGQPISISMPPYTPPQLPPPTVDTDSLRRELREEIRAIREEIKSIVSHPTSSPLPVQGGRVRRIPILDESGNQARDASGNLILQEVPYDETLSTIEALKNTGMLAQPRPVKEFDEEKYELRTREMIRDVVKEVIPKTPDVSEQKGLSDAELKLALQEATSKAQETVKQDLSALNEELKDMREKQAARDTDERISRIISERMGPLQEEINRLERQSEESMSRQGLTDTQSVLVHKENLVKAYSELATDLISSVKGDIRPIITTALSQNLTKTLKEQNVDDSQIAQILQAVMSTPSAAPTRIKSGLAGRVSDARSKWVKD